MRQCDTIKCGLFIIIIAVNDTLTHMRNWNGKIPNNGNQVSMSVVYTVAVAECVIMSTMMQERQKKMITDTLINKYVLYFPGIGLVRHRISP